MNTTSSAGKSRAAILALGALASGAAMLAILGSAGRTPSEAASSSSGASSSGASFRLVADEKGGAKAGKGVGRVVKSEAEWKKILTPDQFEVLRHEGTEAAFSGDYHPKKEAGTWRCAGCGLDLFRWDKQFDSGTGWPSFWQPIAGHVTQRTDADGERSEIRCARCDGHLGHVFDDGPKPTGLRYCMNGVAMKFVPDKK